MHLNLHKTFSIPHGGGGAGAGPVGVAEQLVPFLAHAGRARATSRRAPDGWEPSAGKTFTLDFDRPDAIGSMRSFWSNFAHMVRALAYVYANGFEGLTAGLEAGGAQRELHPGLDQGRRSTSPYDENCRHEFVASAQQLKRETGVRALDIGKALLDRGYHAPTVYFPLLVPECLMIEPTETESKETLDAFIADFRAILAAAKTDPAAMLAAPVKTVGRAASTRRAPRANPICAGIRPPRRKRQEAWSIDAARHCSVCGVLLGRGV